MRAVSYMIAVILALTAPSLAGSADGDLPGVGTFSYRGTPIWRPHLKLWPRSAIERMAQ